MSIGTKGENLIFLISQPRAGSTLLQAILENHPQVHTLPESWIALPSLYGMYSKGIDREYRTEYSRYWARTQVSGFVKWLPRGEEDYLDGIRLMCAHWYNAAMAASGKRFFLDKGPRYYHILPELSKVFPAASFIILLRNPLAVLNSMFEVTKKKGCGIHEFKHDLLHAPRLLLEGARLFGGRRIILRYESLLEDPGAEVGKICTNLGIDFSPAMLQYRFREEYKRGEGYCMQREAYHSGGPDITNVDRWVSALKDPQTWRLTNDYLDYLGKEIFDQMGYSYSRMRQLLDDHDPGWLKLRKTSGLLRLIKRSEIDAIFKAKNRRGLNAFILRHLAYMLN